jgi:SynChlorMet cassette radical SAM/SPASM protein ScmF
MTLTYDPEQTEPVSASQTLDLPEGVPPLTSIYVYAAGSCNLACRHCWIVPKFQTDGPGGPFVKLEHVAKAIREGKSLGLRTIKLTGGEPTSHPQFCELVSLIGEAGLDIAIETNGTLVDVSLAQFLKASSHVCFISVSLDGATPETHDGLRSVEGSFQKAVAGIRNLVDVGFRPQLICSLHKGNVSEMADVATFAEELGCGSVKFNNIQQAGRGEKFQEDHGFKVVEIIQLNQKLGLEVLPHVHIPVYFDIPFAFYPIHRLLDKGLGKCSVKNIIGMLATGELALCGIGVTIPELIYGHIEADSLRDVWCASSGLALLREQVPSQLKGICAQCIHRGFCLGSCVANNYHVGRRLDAPYSFCDQAEQLGLFPVSRKKN